MSHTKTGFDLQERLRELVKLAREQGYLTYDDINKALPEGMVDPDEMDQVFAQLRSLEVDIIERNRG
jgi:RNA polymerase primary sigma factor